MRAFGQGPNWSPEVGPPCPFDAKRNRIILSSNKVSATRTGSTAVRRRGAASQAGPARSAPTSAGPGPPAMAAVAVRPCRRRFRPGFRAWRPAFFNAGPPDWARGRRRRGRRRSGRGRCSSCRGGGGGEVKEGIDSGGGGCFRQKRGVERQGEWRRRRRRRSGSGAVCGVGGCVGGEGGPCVIRIAALSSLNKRSTMRKGRRRSAP